MTRFVPRIPVLLVSLTLSGILSLSLQIAHLHAENANDLVLISANPLPQTESPAVRVIVGEAADQSLQGMQAVAEVIRRRGSLKGFSTLSRENFQEFTDAQPERVWSQARNAWRLSEFSNLSNGARYYDNVGKFGWPSWTKRCKDIVSRARIGDHVFFDAFRCPVVPA